MFVPNVRSKCSFQMFVPNVRWQNHSFALIANYSAPPNRALETHRLLTNYGMSQYRGYFVPGATDPAGTSLRVRGNMTKVNFFKKLLQRLCPESGITVGPSGWVSAKSGFCNPTTNYHLDLPDSPYYFPSIYTTTVAPTVTGTKHETSCSCLCEAINGDKHITLDQGTAKYQDAGSASTASITETRYDRSIIDSANPKGKPYSYY